MVSTRLAPRYPLRRCYCPRLIYSRYCPCRGWTRASECEFLAGQHPGKITVVYVHGNRVTREKAQSRGLEVYRLLTGCVPCGPPVRHVIWSWPSQPIPLRAAVLRDGRVKYRRTPTQSYYLAHWLCRLRCDARVSLLGYSYGGRAIVGALNLLGGGSECGRCLPSCCQCGPRRLRMAIWAPATQSDWLLPGGRHGCALSQLQSGLIFYNRCDPVLRLFDPLILSVTGPALGYVGLTLPYCCCPGYGRVTQFDATCIVGGRHSWDRWMSSACIVNQIRQVALWQGCRGCCGHQGRADQDLQLAESTNTDEAATAH